MGVASSAEAGSASPNVMDTSRSPTRRRSPKQKASPIRSRGVNGEELHRALRNRGLCISESDLAKVLAKHNVIVE